MYVCGNTTSATGLTVTLVRDPVSGEQALEAGALVLSGAPRSDTPFLRPPLVHAPSPSPPLRRPGRLLHRRVRQDGAEPPGPPRGHGAAAHLHRQGERGVWVGGGEVSCPCRPGKWGKRAVASVGGPTHVPASTDSLRRARRPALCRPSLRARRSLQPRTQRPATTTRVRRRWHEPTGGLVLAAPSLFTPPPGGGAGKTIVENLRMTPAREEEECTAACRPNETV